MIYEIIKDLNILDYVTMIGSCTRTQRSLGEKAEENDKNHTDYNNQSLIRSL